MNGYTEMATEKVFIDEVYSFNVAAAFNAPGAFSVTLYYIISNPSVYARVRAEILEEFPNTQNPSYSALKKLPYLVS